MYGKHHQHHHYTHDHHSFEISSDHSTIFLFFYLLFLFLVILRSFLARLEGKVISLLFQLGSNLWEHPAFSARFMYQEKTASFFVVCSTKAEKPSTILKAIRKWILWIFDKLIMKTKFMLIKDCEIPGDQELSRSLSGLWKKILKFHMDSRRNANTYKSASIYLKCHRQYKQLSIKIGLWQLTRNRYKFPTTAHSKLFSRE